MRRIEKLYSYAHMKNDQDTVVKYQNTKPKEWLFTVSLISNFLLSMSQNSWKLQKTNTSFWLKTWTTNLSTLFDRLLQKKEHPESSVKRVVGWCWRIFGAASETFAILTMRISFTMKGRRSPVDTWKLYFFLVESKIKVRKEAYEALWGVYEQYHILMLRPCNKC